MNPLPLNRLLTPADSGTYDPPGVAINVDAYGGGANGGGDATGGGGGGAFTRKTNWVPIGPITITVGAGGGNLATELSDGFTNIKAQSGQGNSGGLGDGGDFSHSGGNSGIIQYSGGGGGAGPTGNGGNSAALAGSAGGASGGGLAGAGGAGNASGNGINGIALGGGGGDGSGTEGAGADGGIFITMIPPAVGEPMSAIVALCQANPQIAAFSGINGPFLGVVPESTAFDYMTITLGEGSPKPIYAMGGAQYIEPQDVQFHVWSENAAVTALTNARVVAQYFNWRHIFSDGTVSSKMKLSGPVTVRRERKMGPGGKEVYHAMAMFRIMVQHSIS